MNHKKPICLEETFSSEQIDSIASIYSKYHKTHTFEECIQLFCENETNENKFGKFEKLSSDRVKLIKKGDKYVKTIP